MAYLRSSAMTPGVLTTSMHLSCFSKGLPNSDTLYQTSVLNYNKAVGLSCFTGLQRSLC